MLLRILAYGYSILLLFGCSSASEEPNETSSNTIRLISLAPHLTELIYLLNQQEYLVGVSEFSNFPEAAKELPRVSNHSAVFKEAVLSVEPTHAFVWKDGISAEGLEFLVEHNIETIEFNPQSLEQIYEGTRQVEEFFGLETTQSDNFLQSVEQLRKQTVSNDLSIFYIAWTNPLISLGGNQLLSEILEVCGSYNVFQDVKQNSFELSLESVIQRQPDIILKSKGTELPDLLSDYPSIDVASPALFRANIGILPDMIQLCKDIAAFELNQ